MVVVLAATNDKCKMKKPKTLSENAKFNTALVEKDDCE